MTLQDIKNQPAKCIFHAYNQNGFAVIGHDDRLYFVHNGKYPSGDSAGLSWHPGGFTTSYCLSSKLPLDTVVAPELFHGITIIETSFLEFKTTKKFEL